LSARKNLCIRFHAILGFDTRINYNQGFLKLPKYQADKVAFDVRALGREVPVKMGKYPRNLCLRGLGS